MNENEDVQIIPPSQRKKEISITSIAKFIGSQDFKNLLIIIGVVIILVVLIYKVITVSIL